MSDVVRVIGSQAALNDFLARPEINTLLADMFTLIEYLETTAHNEFLNAQEANDLLRQQGYARAIFDIKQNFSNLYSGE